MQCNTSLEFMKLDAANGDFHKKWGFRVAVVRGVTGVACLLASFRSTSVEKLILLHTGAVDVLGASVVALASLATARDRLSATYTARVKLAHAKYGSTMFAKKQSKTKMTQRMSISVTIVVSTTRREVDSTFVLSSAITVKRSSRSSHVGNHFAMASLDASFRPITDKTLFRS
jgi:hypothetical protein